MRLLGIAIAALAASGCAQLEFYQGTGPADAHGLPFWVGTPYLQSTVAPDCTQTHQVVMIPTERWTVVPRGGLLGSSNLSAKFASGMITEFGQTTDAQLDETIGALSGAGIIGNPKSLSAPEAGCRAWVSLAPIVGNGAVAFPVVPPESLSPARP